MDTNAATQGTGTYETRTVETYTGTGTFETRTMESVDLSEAFASAGGASVGDDSLPGGGLVEVQDSVSKTTSMNDLAAASTSTADNPALTLFGLSSSRVSHEDVRDGGAEVVVDTGGDLLVSRANGGGGGASERKENNEMEGGIDEEKMQRQRGDGGGDGGDGGVRGGGGGDEGKREQSRGHDKEQEEEEALEYNRWGGDSDDSDDGRDNDEDEKRESRRRDGKCSKGCCRCGIDLAETIYKREQEKKVEEEASGPSGVDSSGARYMKYSHIKLPRPDYDAAAERARRWTEAKLTRGGAAGGGGGGGGEKTEGSVLEGMCGSGGELIVVRICFIIVSNKLRKYFPSGAASPALRRHIRDNVVYLNKAYKKGNSSELRFVPHGGDYAVRCAVGNPMLHFRYRGEEGHDLFTIKMGSGDFPMDAHDMLFPHDKIMKYMRRKYPSFDWHRSVNVIVQEMPQLEGMGDILGLGGLPTSRMKYLPLLPGEPEGGERDLADLASEYVHISVTCLGCPERRGLNKDFGFGKTLVHECECFGRNANNVSEKTRN